MAEALKNLVAARRELATLILNSPALAKAMKSFDRKQAQKIRKPKNKDEEAEELVARIEELAKEEDFVYATIAAGQDGSSSESKNAGEKAEPQDPAKDEPKEAEKKDPAKNDETQQNAKAPDGSQPKGQKGKSPAATQAAGNSSKEPGSQANGGQGENQEGEKTGEQPGSKPEAEKGLSPDMKRQEQSEGGTGEPKKLDRREVAEKQEQIADEIRDLEEKLKRLEAASDLAKARMAKAAERIEKASGDLARGNAREAMEDTKAGAGMLHELARQVKGEIAREVADKLALARDLAEELAKAEADLADRNETPSSSGTAGAEAGKEAKGQGSKPGRAASGSKGPSPSTEPEQLDRLAEMARTLQEWLKQIDKQGEGKAADAVGEILKEGKVNEIVERSNRMSELRQGGNRDELGKEAKELAAKLEVLSEALELLHRGIVAPELASLVEFDRRMAELTDRLGNLKTEGEVAAWRRDVAALIRDLEKAGVEGASDLADAIREGGLRFDLNVHRYLVDDNVTGKLKGASFHIKERVQELMLKDLASSRDESTPPAFRELVDRYYEVISRGVGKK
jgi:hypothetical protein